MSRRPAERRTQHGVMATASEWARIRELAADANMDISRYIVHRATVPDPLPDTVLRRAVRELLLLAKIEEQRMADMGLEDRWKALGDAVDAWLDREAELDRLTDHGAAERWRAVSGRLTRCGRFTGRDGGSSGRRFDRRRNGPCPRWTSVPWTCLRSRPGCGRANWCWRADAARCGAGEGPSAGARHCRNAASAWYGNPETGLAGALRRRAEGLERSRRARRRA